MTKHPILAALLAVRLLTGGTSMICAAVYNVGPGQPYSTIGAVPLAELQPGDTVRIHYRPEPYAEKFVICRQGTANAPITISGVLGPDGERPVITGADALTAQGLNYWRESRGVIKIGGANHPPDLLPMHIVIENLEIRSAHPDYTFTDRNGIAGVSYANNAAAIDIEKGHYITIRNCVLHDCANGIFAGGDTAHLVIEHCHIYGNGVAGSLTVHNAYTESNGILYQHNHFGTLRAGANGNNLKDRSAGCVIRYNWIENGNRQLDLVDSSTLHTLPDYTNTLVYGNVLVETFDDGNRQIVHYGGDSGETARYRKGVLHFFNNTIVSKRSELTTMFRLSTNDEHVECAGNIIYVTQAGNTLAMLDDTGSLAMRDNWLKTGWVPCHFAPPGGTIRDDGGNLTGQEPGFIDTAGGNYRLTQASPCIDSHTRSPTVKPDFDGIPRPLDGNNSGEALMDIGAFEFVHPEADSDNNGMPDWMELIAKTDPTDAASIFRITAVSPHTPPTVMFQPNSAQRHYSLQYRTGLLTGDWVDVDGQTAIPGGGALTGIPHASTVFYRVLVKMPPD